MGARNERVNGKDAVGRHLHNTIALFPASLLNLKLFGHIPKRLQNLVHQVPPPFTVPKAFEQGLRVVPILRIVFRILPVHDARYFLTLRPIWFDSRRLVEG